MKEITINERRRIVASAVNDLPYSERSSDGAVAWAMVRPLFRREDSSRAH